MLLVLLPGLDGTGILFQPLIEALPKDSREGHDRVNCRVTADERGGGGRGRRRGGRGAR